MNIITVIPLIATSAVAGRLLLTREQAWRTVTVRIPALLGLVTISLFALAFWLMWGAICFVGGSFYGLGQWWWPQLSEALEGDGAYIGAILTGRWE